MDHSAVRRCSPLNVAGERNPAVKILPKFGRNHWVKDVAHMYHSHTARHITIVLGCFCKPDGSTRNMSPMRVNQLTLQTTFCPQRKFCTIYSACAAYHLRHSEASLSEYKLKLPWLAIFEKLATRSIPIAEWRGIKSKIQNHASNACLSIVYAQDQTIGTLIGRLALECDLQSRKSKPSIAAGRTKQKLLVR